MENNSSIDIIARGMAANAESGVSGLKASVSEILRSMADPYDPTHTYTSGQLVMYDGRLYRAISDITTPEPWTPEHWQSVDLEDEITRLREAVEAKYTKPTTGIPDTDLDDGVNASLDRANSAALPDGYYGESGGVFQYSTNFLGENTPQNASNVVFRPTASQMSGQSWSADSISGQTATIEKIKGNTLVFNQLVDSSTTEVATINEHKYITKIDGVFSLITSTGQAISVTGGSDMVIDLTQMYGQGREPQSVDEFKAQFPLDYYQYNTGELISLNATGLKTNGFNQWDGTWRKGNYNDQGEFVPNEGHRATANLIPVFPNMDYYASCPASMVSQFANGRIHYCMYDASKNFIGKGQFAVNSTINFGNAQYVALQWNSVTSDEFLSHICFNLSWSGIRNGEYEPYRDSTLSLPIATYFPDGMKSAGTVYDELTRDKAVKRIGKVDLGDITFGYTSVLSNKFYNYSSFNDMVLHGVVATARFNYTNAPHTEMKNNEISTQLSGIISISTKGIVIKDTSHTDEDLVGGKAPWLSGVMLYYELETPVETPINPPLNLTYRCDDFGTEMLLPQNTDEPVTAPMDADITYQLDYEADVRNMGQNMISKSSMDNFISAFNASGLGTITMAWDATNKKYNYTVTAPQPTEGGETV